MTSFTKKLIDLTITLGIGSFGGETGDTVTIRQTRIFADLINAGGEAMGAAQIRVYGLSQKLMNKLTTIGQINTAIRAKNTVTLAAGDADGMSLAFFGTIVDSFADYNAAPEVPLIIMAKAGMDVALRPVNATGYKGVIDALDIAEDLAKEAELLLGGEIPDIKLTNPYFCGSTLNKIRMFCRASGLQYNIDRGILSFWKSGGFIKYDTIPKIGPGSSMIGYPTLSSKGAIIRCSFIPNLKYGSQVEIDSSIPMANGLWVVFGYHHSLSSEAPGGPWETTIEVSRVG